MKRMIFVLIVCGAIPLPAGEQTLISGQVDHGGYGGPVLKYSQVGPNKADGLFVGGQGGWIIDHTFVIGGGGYGLSSRVAADWYDAATDASVPGSYILSFGYGGLLLEYINRSNELVHFEIFSLIGGGGVDYVLDDHLEHDDAMSDGLFVVEPGANLIVNVSPFFRIGFGISYRYVSGVDIIGLTDSDLSGLGGHIVLKFGAF
ncbi:hypothetical protein JXA02_00915 [candidate division KSB1 bacterium]|nr:hypothetical protein [candidate division KSB1 bacterium]RQW11356.1 MAG: hypothetical protein EH222_00970 [candidate division KSB1 bacterium]